MSSIIKVVIILYLPEHNSLILGQYRLLKSFEKCAFNVAYENSDQK